MSVRQGLRVAQRVFKVTWKGGYGGLDVGEVAEDLVAGNGHGEA